MPRIDISWEGPLSAEQVKKLKDKRKNRGVYAVYGRSSVYGPGDVLLYIGKTIGKKNENNRTFSVRIREHQIWRDGLRYGGTPMQYYVGRLCGERQLGNKRRKILIDVAERLLIHSHSPSWNTQHINTLELPEGYENARVFNWGYYGDLLPEVSGARWYVGEEIIDKIIDSPWEYAP